MLRRRLTMVGAAALAVASLALAPLAQANAETRIRPASVGCTEPAPGSSVGTFTVPAGAVCDLDQVTATSVRVMNGGTLFADESHIGTVTTPDGAARSITLNGGSAQSVSINVSLSAFIFAEISTLKVSGQGGVEVASASISGDATIAVSGAIWMYYTSVEGRVSCATGSGLKIAGGGNAFGSGSCGNLTSGEQRNFPPSGVRGDTSGDGSADLFVVDSQGLGRYYTGTRDGNLSLRGGTWLWGGITWANKVKVAGDLAGDPSNEGLLYRSDDGTLYFASSAGNGALWGQKKVGTGWNGLDLLTVVGDMNGDGTQDLVGRDADNNLVRYSFSEERGVFGKKVIGKNWGQVRHLIGTGSSNDDRYADISAIDTEGRLFLYTSDSTGTLVTKRQTGRGWNGWNLVVSPGDFNGDGRMDLIGRSPEGILSSYLQLSGSKWSPRKQLGGGWNGIQVMA